MNKFLTPLILLGSAVGAIKRGEDGLAIGLIAGVMLLMLVLAFMEEGDERRARNRRAQESRDRQARFK